MTAALRQTGKRTWFTADRAFQIMLLTMSDARYPARPYGIRQARSGESAFAFVSSLDQVPEAIEEYKNRLAIEALTGKPMGSMMRWLPKTPPRKKAQTIELFGQRLPRPGVRR